MFKSIRSSDTSDMKMNDIAVIVSKPLNLPDGFTVTAHAGALGFPANTLIALNKAIELGVDIVEMDVTFRSNKVPVIIHSEKPRKNQGILFEDALKLVAGHDRVRVNLDLKSFANLPIIQELAEKYDMLNRVFFTGVCEEKVNQVRSACPKIPMYLNAAIPQKRNDDFLAAQLLADKLLTLGCLGLNCNFSQISKTILDTLHKNALLVSVWTVDDELEMYRMLSLAVDNITTRKPDMLEGIINNWK